MTGPFPYTVNPLWIFLSVGDTGFRKEGVTGKTGAVLCLDAIGDPLIVGRDGFGAIPDGAEGPCLAELTNKSYSIGVKLLEVHA